jgi:predicted ATPase/DNA-binding CsgD family transcriptional regulator
VAIDARTTPGTAVGEPRTASVRAEVAPNTLPAQLTSFVGRERELAEIGGLLADHRLVTLVGTGGCGKTRLAMKAAFGALERFPKGAWWVELAPLADERLVGGRIAEALGVRPLPGMTELQAACAYLASRSVLVVLDNCEHLLEACAEAAEAMIGSGPGVVVLATSRSPLGARGETDWRVPSLSVDGERSDAVRLFAERAQAVRPELEWDPRESERVTEICTQLDGLPLAIELAAARLRVLSLEQIATGLSDRFRLLAGGPRTETPRLKSLRASVAWSHELLTEAERTLLRRLAVFAGGVTLAGVEEVCDGEDLERDQVLDLLASLLDQSLVVAEERGATMRYRLLETVRQYGLELLAEAGEEETVRARHRDYFLALAEEAGPHLETGRQRKWLELLDPEAANLAAAIDYALDIDPSLALRLCVALHRWWGVRGRYAEAELAFTRALEAGNGIEPGLRARAFEARAYLAIWAGDQEAATEHATEALALADEADDLVTPARARCHLGTGMLYSDPKLGRIELRRAAELAEASGDDWALVTAEQLRAVSFFFQSEHRELARAMDDVAAPGERLADPFLVARRWVMPGLAAVHDARFPEARDAVVCMEAAGAVDEPFMGGLADVITAHVYVNQGEPEQALELLGARLEVSLNLGAGLVVGPLLLVMAFAELAADRPEQARARLEPLPPLVDGRDAYASAFTHCALAEAQRVTGDESAGETASRAREVAEGIENRFVATWARWTLGRLAAARGDFDDAREHAHAHLDACVDGGHALLVPRCLDALAEVAAGTAGAVDGARLLGAADRARAELGTIRIPPEEGHWAAIEAALRDELGEDAYEAARVEGAEMPTEDAIEWARRSRGSRGRPTGGWGSLTPTETKVAELVAEGLTNAQVAERMFVSPATVKTHVAHVFQKLNVHKRAEVAALAARRSAGST